MQYDNSRKTFRLAGCGIGWDIFFFSVALRGDGRFLLSGNFQYSRRLRHRNFPVSSEISCLTIFAAVFPRPLHSF